MSNGQLTSNSFEPKSFGRLSIHFYSYYNDFTVIHVQLKPFLQIIASRDQSEEALVRQIKSNWMKKASTFGDDERFKNANIKLEEVFVEIQTIPVLMALAKQPNIVDFLRSLYDICIRKLENKRLLNVHAKHSKLSTCVLALDSKCKALEAKLQALQEDHESKHSFLKDTLHEFCSNQSNLLKSYHENHGDVLKSLFEAFQKM